MTGAAHRYHQTPLLKRTDPLHHQGSPRR